MQSFEPAPDTSAQSDYALDVLSGVAARMDMVALDLIRARGRLPGESALDFEMRAMWEARRGGTGDYMEAKEPKDRLAELVGNLNMKEPGL